MRGRRLGVVGLMPFSMLLFQSCSSDTRAPISAVGHEEIAAAPARAALESALPPSSLDLTCPSEMVLVAGNYCPDAEQRCLRWLDPPGPYHHFRCAEYAQPSRCRGARTPLRFCIDRTERTDEPGALPTNFLSYEDSERLCASYGARVCREREWIFACEGEEMRPYPYGFARDSSACNVDIGHGLGKTGALVDHRIAGGSNARCKSSFGVFDQAGNLEEWVAADKPVSGFKNVMKGSWWIPSRHHCRGFQIGHDTRYKGAETGTRCCRDAG